MDNEAIRRDILRLLYALHDEDPADLIECARLAERLQIPKARMVGNVRYLEDKGYITVIVHRRGTRRYEFAQITSEGIELVERPEKLDEVFPRREVHYHYHGDYINVEMGDHNTNVVIGKGIYQFNVGSLHPLGEVVNRLIKEVSTQKDLPASAIEEVERRFREILSILRESEPDFGALQVARRSLVSYGGWVEAATLAFFRQPEVTAQIRRAAEHLIGRWGGD